MGVDATINQQPVVVATQQVQSISTDNSMLGVVAAIAVVALSAALVLPLSVVSVLVAALAGVWWLSTGSSCTSVQMSPLPGRASGSSAAAALNSSTSAGQQVVTAAAGGQQQDENLGLDPPTYATGGRSVTAKRSSLAAAAVAAVPAAKVVAAQSTAAQSTVPPVAGDGAAKAAALTANSTSTASPAGLHATAGTPAASAPAATAVRPPSADAPLQQQPRQAPAVPAPAPAPEPAAAATSVEAAAAPAALTGSAAILAKLRQQRQSSSASGRDSSANASKAGREAKITVLYASQTGTGQEIARSIHAECAAKGLPAQVMSMNELGFDNLTPAKTPVVVVVASSTGDGDPPDDSAAAYVALKKSWPADRMAGVKFTVLGLGDSNYTRFMHVPRVIKSRLQDLGGVCFYPCAEADEVDGLEATVDPWVENILSPLQQALQELKQQTPGAAAAAAAGTETPPAAAAASRPTSAGVGAGTTGAVEVEVAAAAAASAAPVLSAEGSATSTGSAATAVAAAAASTAAVAAGAASLSPAASVPVELVNGLAPKGVDLKGVPPLAPCRITVSQMPAAAADAVREKEQQLPSREQLGYRDPTGAYSAAAPFWANVSDAKLLTADSSDRTVIHVELDLSDSGMRFAAGDALGVLPRNDPALVESLLSRLGVDGDAVFEVLAAGDTSGQALLNHIAWPCTFRHAFTTGTDLTSVPRKSLLRLLAEHCSDEDEQRTLLFFTSRAGRDAYTQEVAAAQPSLVDLLRRFPSCQPPVEALLDVLPPLAPRMYSLTNAPVAGPAAAGGGVPGAVGPRRAQFALSVVEFETQYGTRRGVATTWLAKLCRPWLSGQVAPGTEPSALPEVWVPLFLRHAAFFKPPANLATPMIMIGPGTGVAPFRGFLQQRLADMQAAKVNTPGQALLYFGCRKPDEDYLYEQDWQAFTDAGVLTKLRVAFSRAQQHKVYVQHLLKEDAAEVAKLIAGGAYVYVCGDGAAMAKDVHAALQAILRDKLGMSEAQAAQELTAMTKDGRYVRDIWS